MPMFNDPQGGVGRLPGLGSPLSLGAFIANPGLNPWGTANDVATQAAYQRYLANNRGGLPAGAGAPAFGPEVPGGRSLPGSYNPASGGIPQTTPPAASMAELLAGITANLGALTPVIGGVTAAENKALRDQYPAEYFTGLGTALGNVNERVKGNIADLLPNLYQQGAEFGIGSGVGTNSPAFQSKLARDVLGSAYNVQRQGLQDLGAIQNLIPRVNPYSATNLVANVGQQIASDYMRNIFGAAPVPEAAAQRARAWGLEGLGRGFNAGGGGGGGSFYGGQYALPVGAGTPVNIARSNPFFNPHGGGGDWLGLAGVERGLPAGLEGYPAPPVGGPGYFDTIGNIWDTPLDLGGGLFDMGDYTLDDFIGAEDEDFFF